LCNRQLEAFLPKNLSSAVPLFLARRHARATEELRHRDRPKAALDYLLASSSVKTNPYLAAFVRTPFVQALQDDPSYDSLRKFANMKKEVTEASAALVQIRRCIARLDTDDPVSSSSPRAPDDDDDDGEPPALPPESRRRRHDNDADDGGSPPPESRRHRHRDDGEGLSFVDLCSGKGFLSTMLAW
jgi:hypothetical protein